MRRAQRVLTLLLLLLAGALAAIAMPAAAHAYLLKGQPGINEHVTTAPQTLYLQFTEDLEHEYTHAELFDVNGTRFDEGRTEFIDGQPNAILVPLQPFGDGVYTVHWFTLSVDTHTADGTYLFAVGNATLTGAPATAAHHHGDGAFPIQVESAARAMFFGGLALIVGLPVFRLWVDRPGTPENERHRRGLAFIGGATAVVGTLGGIIVCLAFADRIGFPVWPAVTATHTGRLLGARTLAVALGGAGLVIGARARHAGASRAGWGAALCLGVLGIAATSLSSHAGALRDGQTLALWTDALHVGAGSLWLGGVVGIAVTLQGRTPAEAAHVVKRFTPLALVSVGIIVTTGVLAGTLHLQAWSQLWTTVYGAAILAKSLLVLGLIGLGALNKFLLGPRLAKDQSTPRALFRSVATESCLLALVLLAAGVLTTSAPPSVAAGPQPLEFQEELRDAHMVFTIEPNPVTVGIQHFFVQLHAAGKPIPNGTTIFLKFQAPQTIEPDHLEQMQPAGFQTWALNGGYLTERGVWTIYVLVADEKVHFDVNVN